MLMHDYLILNVAIAVGFILAKIMLHFPKISHSHKLKFSRGVFITTIGMFFVMPLIKFSTHSHFQLGPMIRTVSDGFMSPHKVIAQEMIHVGVASSSLPINTIMLILLSMGVAVFLSKYIKDIIYLYKIKKQAYRKHKINKIHVLFSENINTPFCWSFLNNYYIALPNHYLEKYDDLKLALRHELQHIRQSDTHWLHLLLLIKALCFWNPFMKLWIYWLDETQEFSCDEAIVVAKKTSPVAYAQCLINAASGYLPQGALGIHGLSKSILYRRVNMVFNLTQSKTKKLVMACVYVGALVVTTSAAYAINGQSDVTPLSKQQVEKIIQQSNFNPSFQISATPEVVKEINNIRSSEQAQSFISDSLQRMKKYQPYIQSELTKNNMPHELLAIPLVESGYQPLPPNVNPVQAAGVWQFIPKTAQKFGLVINGDRDDRMDTTLSTKAALAYLTQIHAQFNNWGLAVVSYEFGENNIAQLSKATKSSDVWTMARSPEAPKTMKQFVATFDASLIIMKNPSILTS